MPTASAAYAEDGRPGTAPAPAARLCVASSYEIGNNKQVDGSDALRGVTLYIVQAVAPFCSARSRKYTSALLQSSAEMRSYKVAQSDQTFAVHRTNILSRTRLQALPAPPL